MSGRRPPKGQGTVEVELAELGRPEHGLALFSAGGAAAELNQPPAELEIFTEGQWVTHPFGKFKMTGAIFDQIIANRVATKDDPCIDVEHRSALPLDDSPAEGWIKELRKGPSSADPAKLSLYGKTDWSDVGRDDVLNKRYRYVSGGVFLKDRDRRTGEPIGARLDHVALVKKAFIQGMQPLTASSNFPGSGRADGGPMSKLIPFLCSVFAAPADADEAATEAAILAKAEPLRDDLVDLIKNGRGLRLSADAFKALNLSAPSTASEVGDAILALAKKAATGEALVKRVEALEDEKIVGEVDGLISSFKATPAEKDDLLKLAKSDYSLFKSMTSKRQAKPPVGSEIITAGGKRSGERASLQAKAIAEYQVEQKTKFNKEVGYRDALLACAAAQPDLFREDGTAKEGA